MSGGKVHSMTGNWCRVLETRRPSCHQPVIKTSTGPHSFFNHQQTPEVRDITPFYACSQKSVSVINHLLQQRKYLERTAVRVDPPDVLKSNVHRLPILELMFKLNTLARHLYADKHADESSRQSVDHRVSLKQTLTLVTIIQRQCSASYQLSQHKIKKPIINNNRKKKVEYYCYCY